MSDSDDKIFIEGDLEQYAQNQNAQFRSRIQEIENELEREKKRRKQKPKSRLTGVIETLRQVHDAPDDWEFFCNDDEVGFKAPQSETEG
jgi:hypothetical protein